MGITLAQFIVRGAIYSTAIIGGGYALMIATTPSPEKLKAEMDKYRELRGEAAMKIEEQQIASQMQLILLNAQSDHPAWDVRGINELLAEKKLKEEKERQAKKDALKNQ